MVYIVFIAFMFALVMSPTLRCAVSHPFALIYHGARDFWQYIRHKEFNLCGTGELPCCAGRCLCSS